MKKNKGFTLIELLVVIALMLSLLGIAIISFVNVSNKKKEQAYKLVKEQAVTAGEEFFDTNSYMFEGLGLNGTSGIITIGKLVDEDYLNVLTNPKTGKKINKCDYVEVTRTNSGYNTKYVESNSTNCQDTENTIVVQEAGAPSIEMKIIGTYNIISKWYFKNKPSAYAVVKTNNNGPIMKVEKCLSSSCSDEKVKNASSFKTNTTWVEDGRKIRISYKATNSSGKSAVAITTIDVDTVKPDCTSNISNNKASTNWYNNSTGAPKITFKGTDALSDIDGKRSITPTIKPGKDVFYSQKFKDNAGNENSCSIEVSYDNTNPKCNITLSGTKGNNNWYTSNVTLSISGTDTLSGISNSSYILNNQNISKITWKDSGTNIKVPGSVKDNAGNSGSCNVQFKMDNQVPSFTFNTNETTYYKYGKQQTATYYTSSGNKAYYSGNAPGWDPAVSHCGISGCQDIQVKGCAKNNNGTWQHKNFSTTFLQSTCRSGDSNIKGNCNKSNSNDKDTTKNYFKYKYRVCSNAGLCSDNNGKKFEIEHFYNGNTNNYGGCSYYGE